MFFKTISPDDLLQFNNISPYLSVGVRDIPRLYSVCAYVFFFFFFILRRRLVKKYLCFFPTNLARSSCGKYTHVPSSVPRLQAGAAAPKSPLAGHWKKKYKGYGFLFFFVYSFGFFSLLFFYCYIFPIIIFPVCAKSLGNYRPVLYVIYHDCSFA